MGRVSRWCKRALLRCGVEVARGPHAVMIRRVGRRRVAAREWSGASGLRLNLGSGGKPFEGYVNVDIVLSPEVDLVAPMTDLSMLPDGCAVEIRLEAVYEHLYRWERPEALDEWHRLLQPGGVLIINWIPDFDTVIDLYRSQAAGLVGETFDLEHVYRYTHGLPTRFNAPHQLHKDIFTRETLTAEIIAAGFAIERIDSVCFESEPYALNLNVVARKPGGPGDE